MATGSGTGATVVFSSGSTYSGQVISFNIDGEEVPVIDMTHLGTTSYREKKFGTLVEPPQVTLEINFDPASPPPVGVSATCTITFPDTHTFAGTGAFISRSFSNPLEDKMTASVVFQYDGQTGPTFT